MKLKEYIEVFEDIKWYGDFFSIKSGTEEIFFQRTTENRLEVTYSDSGKDYESFILDEGEIERFVAILLNTTKVGAAVYTSDVKIVITKFPVDKVILELYGNYTILKVGGVAFELTTDEIMELGHKLQYYLETGTIKDITV